MLRTMASNLLRLGQLLRDIRAEEHNHPYEGGVPKLAATYCNPYAYNGLDLRAAVAV